MFQSQHLLFTYAGIAFWTPDFCLWIAKFPPISFSNKTLFAYPRNLPLWDSCYQAGSALLEFPDLRLTSIPPAAPGRRLNIAYMMLVHHKHFRSMPAFGNLLKRTYDGDSRP